MLCLMLQLLLWSWSASLRQVYPLTAASIAAFAEGGMTVEALPEGTSPPASGSQDTSADAIVNPASTPEEAEVTETPAPGTDEDLAVFRVEVLREESTQQPWAGKRVLIYHTHTWEAYEQSPDAPYRETEKWRTKDESCNVVAVGYALAASLRAMGVTVIHDTTAFEPPSLDDAYERSLAMLEERTAAGESYDLYIDLHRDAVASTSTIRRTVNIGGEEAARFMVLVGQGVTGGYSVRPDWERNLVLAQEITDALNAQCDGLARDVKIKTGRFNQHIAPRCVLIECGMNTNTLAQVLRGVPYLAQAIAQTLALQE